VYVNFVKTGNPNGVGVPNWPAANIASPVQVLYLGGNPRVEPERHRERYLFLDHIYVER
jgi:para-nitrobenzyl esterase